MATAEKIEFLPPCPSALSRDTEIDHTKNTLLVLLKNCLYINSLLRELGDERTQMKDSLAEKIAAVADVMASRLSEGSSQSSLDMTIDMNNIQSAMASLQTGTSEEISKFTLMIKALFDALIKMLEELDKPSDKENTNSNKAKDSQTGLNSTAAQGTNQ
jgi:hypothetical protein